MALHFVQDKVPKSCVARLVFFKSGRKGKLALHLIVDPPVFLRSLLSDDKPRTDFFCRNIRAYNVAISIASVVVKWVNRGPGPSNFNPTMKIQGDLYEYKDPKMSSERRAPSYSSVCIHNTDYVTQTRKSMGTSRGLGEMPMPQLTHMLHECKLYVQKSSEYGRLGSISSPQHSISVPDSHPRQRQTKS